MAVFCYTVSLTAVIKAETLVIRLRAVPKKLRDIHHCAESLKFANCSANSQPYAKISCYCPFKDMNNHGEFKGRDRNMKDYERESCKGHREHSVGNGGSDKL
jgi:hypothetical protein